MIPPNQASPPNSKPPSQTYNLESNFKRNNTQIIALFAPKPIQSHNSSNHQCFASKNDTIDSSNEAISIQEKSRHQAQTNLKFNSQNSKHSNDLFLKIGDDGSRQHHDDDLQHALVNMSFENQSFSSDANEAQRSQVTQQRGLNLQEDQNDDAENDVEVYRAKGQAYNHERDLQIAGREIFQILNQSRDRQQAHSRMIFIENSENPHASFLDKLNYRQQPQSFSQFSTCSQINVKSNPCLANFHNCEDSFYLQNPLPIRNLRSSNRNTMQQQSHQQEEEEDEEQDGQFFFGDAYDDDDDYDDHQGQNLIDNYKNREIRTLHDVLAEQYQEVAFLSRSESFYNIALQVPNYMNNQSQKKIIKPATLLNQSQNLPRKSANFHTQQLIN